MVNNLRFFFTHTYSRTVGLIFAVNSLMFGSWITRLPEVQNRLMVSDGELGLALLGLPLGSVSMMPVIGFFINKYGAGRTTLFFAVLFCFASTLPILAPTYFTLFIAMVLVGLTTGSMDVAMNAAAAAVEKKNTITIMSTCHGMWSLGGMIGAGGTALLAVLRIDAIPHILILAVVLLILVFRLSATLLEIKEDHTATVLFSLPTGPLLGLAVICFCVMLSEGAIYDWSAVYLRNTLLAGPVYAGLGYAGFSLTMAAGRFYGDQVIHAWGNRRVVLVGAFFAIAGVAVGLIFRYPPIVVAGYTLAGLGYSCLVPALYITASRMPGRIAGANIAAVASLGYFGLLAGPAAIGAVADYYGLSSALWLVVLLLTFAILLAAKARFN